MRVIMYLGYVVASVGFVVELFGMVAIVSHSLQKELKGRSPVGFHLFGMSLCLIGSAIAAIGHWTTGDSFF